MRSCSRGQLMADRTRAIGSPCLSALCKYTSTGGQILSIVRPAGPGIRGYAGSSYFAREINGAISGSAINRAAVQVGMPVGKSGRTTQLTNGRITDCNASIRVNFGAQGVANFRDQITIRGTRGNFSQGGDSGVPDLVVGSELATPSASSSPVVVGSPSQIRSIGCSPRSMSDLTPSATRWIVTRYGHDPPLSDAAF